MKKTGVNYEKIDNEVLSVLSNSIVIANTLKLPKTQLERDLYLRVNKVLAAFGGKWDRKTKSHIFKEDISDILEATILTGEYTDIKTEFQFFETPEHIVNQMLGYANIGPSDTVLEPSAGRGSIAKHIPKCDCIELNDENYRFLVQNGFNVVGRDFLMFNPGYYDIVIGNPPFTKQQDIDHIVKMIQVAHKRVISIASAGVMWRSNKKSVQFRDTVKLFGGMFIELPEDSFKESGTRVNTCIVVVDKESV